MSVLTVSPYRPKTAFRYLADTNVLDRENTPVNIFAVLKCRFWDSTIYFLLKVRKNGFDAFKRSLQGCFVCFVLIVV